MTDRERELINRYVYEVTKRVSKKQREEIEKELRELIGDMLESYTLEETFSRLGDPAVFARQYREERNYVISPEYYDNYMWVLKIVLICTALGLIVAAVVKCVIDAGDIFYTILRFFDSLLTAAVMVFGAVTLIFAVLERQKVKIELKREKTWTPALLNPIPDKKARISRGDCMVSLVFLILFSCLLIFAPQLMGAYAVKDGEVLYVPVFNLAKWDILLPVLLLSIAVGFVDEIIRLVTGCHCKIVMYSSIITNTIGIFLAVFLLKVLPIWNSNFAKEIKEQFDDSFKLKVLWQNKMVLGWDGQTLSNILLTIIIAASVLEIAFSIYKTMRYGRQNLE